MTTDNELQSLLTEIERLNNALRWEQHRADHMGTHGEGCWKWGPSHYECALKEIQRVKKENTTK
jgi:hypothetical protein